eukprot:1140355-Pelagomonas_calceolata.AAC.11
MAGQASGNRLLRALCSRQGASQATIIPHLRIRKALQRCRDTCRGLKACTSQGMLLTPHAMK